MNKYFWTKNIFFIILTLPILFLACGKSSLQSHEGIFPYGSFRDVPGVTDAEIRAIETLKRQRTSFVYAMLPGTEAFYSQDGNIKGYSALFCEWLTGFIGIPFNVQLFTWNEIISGLDSYDIDFAGDLTASPERLKTYFMTDPIAARSFKFVRLSGSLPLNEITQTRPLRSAFLNGSIIIEQITSKMEPGSFEIVLIDDTSLAYDCLISGRADVYYYESSDEALFDHYEGLIHEDFIPVIYGQVSMAAQNPALEPVISVVQKAMRNSDSRFFAVLYNRGYREYLKNKINMQLTAEEKSFIRSNPVIKLVAENDNYPISFYNKQEGQWQGIVFDVLDEISVFTGLEFEIANDHNANWYSIFSMLENGEVPMITELIKSDVRKERFLWPDNRIMTDSYVLISKEDHRNISANEILFMKVGLIRGSAYAELFMNWFPYHRNYVMYDSLNQAYEALNRNEINMVMSSQHQFLILTNYLELPGYKINIDFDYVFDSTFGFNNNEVVLCSVIDKTLGLIDTKRISGQWMQRTFDYRVKLTQARIPWVIFATALVLGLFFLFILLQRNRGIGKQLEKSVQERTAELQISRQKLESALIAAKNANTSKSVFLANMSHEIRTPMNSIVGFSELALDNETTPKTRDYLKKIQANAEWLLQIINDILDISKIESGKMELENIPFDIHELFSSCRALVIPKAVEKGIMLHFYAEPSIGRKPMGDPTRLRQVFVNLLTNSIKFANTGMVKLLSDITNMTENTITMHFEIKDSGIGMTSDQIEKIFSPFTQAETGTTRKYGGTGLGLAITKNIVEQMGGQLSVESTPGIGSKFSFDLTFNTISISEDERQHRKSMLKEIPKPVFNGEILLCEDNIMNQQVICEHLERVGIKTMVAENGKIGVDMVMERIRRGGKLFDLVFMDMHMPVMDGLEAAEKIRELNTGIPIVAMTANIMIDDLEVYKMSGMPDCIGKPFTSQELWRCLLKYLTPVGKASTLENNEAPVEADMEFKRSLQEYFIKNNRRRFKEIIEVIESGDIKTAHRMTHTLKTNAGQIGLVRLQHIAAEVEKQLRDGKDLTAREQMTLLESEINDALYQLQSQLAAAENAPETKKTDGSGKDGQLDIQELFETLEPMLRLGNADCFKLIDSIRNVPDYIIEIPGGSNELKSNLIHQIEDFDFDAALVTFAEIKENWAKRQK